ncbi:MAG: hypothetical protein AAB462_02515 [Patescibacteria group bacterium]
MASEHQMFNRAQAKWSGLIEAGNLSVPVEIGRTAVISSYFTDEEPDTVTGMSELAMFRGEALDLADRIQQSGGDPELAIDATRHDINRLIQDPEIANIYVIGNGSLSSLLLDVKDYYDWKSVSEATTHIKQGIFVQRQCGNLSRVRNVPMGLFAITDPRNVHAALGDDFYPLNLDDVENEKIKPVFGTDQVDYDSIRRLGAKAQPSNITEREADDAQLQSDVQYRGNFFERFIELKAIAEGRASDSQVIYIRMVKERFGLDLLDFYENNIQLCEAINDAVEAKESWEVVNSLLEQAYSLLEPTTLNAPFLAK